VSGNGKPDLQFDRCKPSIATFVDLTKDFVAFERRAPRAFELPLKLRRRISLTMLTSLRSEGIGRVDFRIALTGGTSLKPRLLL